MKATESKESKQKRGCLEAAGVQTVVRCLGGEMSKTDQIFKTIPRFLVNSLRFFST